MRRRWIGAAVAIMLIASSSSARENLETERALAEVMLTPAETPAEGERARSWALLPQVGYSPDRGINGGIKITDRDVSPAHLTLDLDAVYALRRQQRYRAFVSAPRLGLPWLIALLEGRYEADPTKEFFGIGNNEVGPDPLSTHEAQTVTALLTLGARPVSRLTLALTGGFSDTRIRRGRLEGGTPSTVDRFSGLAGIRGGRTNPLSVSIVYNNREDITRPTRGWSLTVKAQHVDRRLGNDFEFTRYILDASYLRPLLTRRQVLGLRVGGEFIDAERRQLPFFELASLGGADDLRGFFKDRFLGRSRVMINGEYRLKLLDFDFLDLWPVKIDGVLFGDMGRVFADEDDLRSEFQVEADLLPRIFRDFRYSYGGGLRFALGRVILARIDVGFSEEETALVYLTFGHTF